MPSNFIRTVVVVALALSSMGANAQQRPVNDTGVISCTNEGWAGVTCESVNITLPGQDAVFGRDALSVVGSLNKTGSGRRGFDLTKIGADGSVVPATAGFGNAAGQYRCVRDNTTGLVWEAYAELHYWRDPNPATNGGFIGTENSGDTTDAYVSAANSNPSGRCNRTNWRLPTVRELLSAASFERTNGLGWGDYAYFNSVQEAWLWSAQTDPARPELVSMVALTWGGATPTSVQMFSKLSRQWTVLVSSQ